MARSEPLYVAMHMFGASSDEDTFQDALRIKTEVFKGISALLAERKVHNVHMLDGDGGYGVNVDKLTKGDQATIKKVQQLNSRICLTVFLVMHDAENNNYVFDERELQSAMRSWNYRGTESKKTLLEQADEGQQITVFPSSKLDPAYVAFARFRLATRGLSPYAVVVVEAPENEMTSDAFARIHPKLIKDKMAKNVALGGNIPLKLDGPVLPMLRLIPSAVEVEDVDRVVIPFKYATHGYDKTLAKVNTLTLGVLADKIENYVDIAADITKSLQRTVISRQKVAMGCKYCGGNGKGTEVQVKGAYAIFGCSYCGAGPKRNKTLEAPKQASEVTPAQRDAAIRKLLFNT